MKKILFAVMASVALFAACDEVEIPATLTIPEESLAYFEHGISFVATSEEGGLSAEVSFTASLDWSVSIKDSEGKSVTWLTVRPESGSAGDATITVKASDNTEKTARTANITVSCGGFSKTIAVTQAAAKDSGVVVEGDIHLNKTSLSLVKEETAQLQALDADGNVLKASWSSSDPRFVEVDQNGLVTAKDENPNAITITATVGTKTATCSVMVVPEIYPQSVSLDEENITLKIGQSRKLTLHVTPADATMKYIHWVSVNPAIATVDDEGTVTGVAKGAVHVNVFIGEGTNLKENEIAHCLVTVTNEDVVPVTSISLDKTKINLNAGETETITATVTPANTNEAVNWKPVDPTIVQIVKVEGNKATIKGSAPGTTDVQVIAGNKVFASCQVTVTKAGVEVSSVTLDKTSLELSEGQSALLTATVKPDNATDKTVTWSSSNESVASVKDGYVYGVKAGNATITATAGGKSATCQVTVKAVEITISSIAFNPDTRTMYVGKTDYVSVNVQYTPADALPDITWVSDNPSIVEVQDASGAGMVGSGTKALKAKAVGTAHITATAGGKSATLTVTVEEVKLATIELSNKLITMTPNETSRLMVLRFLNNDGSEATGLTVEWHTNLSSIATVAKMSDSDPNTAVVTAVAVGSAIITASVGGVQAECMIQVRER